MQSIMQRNNLTNRKYGLLILAAILGIALFVGAGDGIKNNIMQDAIYGEDSPLATPWEWFGVACISDVTLTGVPFPVQITHVPGRSRDVVDDAVQNLPSQNGTREDEPYSEENLQSYLITKTHCFDSWREIYDQWNWIYRGQVDAFLPADRTPSEADYRTAILHASFPDHFEVADRMFPLEAALHSTVERWEE